MVVSWRMISRVRMGIADFYMQVIFWCSRLRRRFKGKARKKIGGNLLFFFS